MVEEEVGADQTAAGAAAGLAGAVVVLAGLAAAVVLVEEVPVVVGKISSSPRIMTVTSSVEYYSFDRMRE